MPRDLRWLLLCVAAGPVLGAELVVRDWDARLESLPTAFTYTAGNTSFSRSGSDHFRSAFGLAAGGRYALAAPGRAWGLLLGCDGAVADARGASTHLLTTELRGIAGLAWQLDGGLLCCVQLAAGLGYGRMTIDQAGGASSGQTGSLTPGLGLWWNSSERSRLTCEVGWRLQGAALHHGDTAIDLHQSGACIAIGMTWGLSRAPWSLE